MKERTMTIECSDCHHIYGLWRPQCPACGSPNPKYSDHRATIDPPVMVKIPTERREHSKECIACHRNGAKLRCLHCNEPVHKLCLTLHADACAEFQISLRESERKLLAVNEGANQT